VQNLEVGMSGEKDRCGFEAVSGGAAEVCEGKGAESRPAGAEKEVVCNWEVLALSTPVLVANIQRLVDGRSNGVLRLEPGLLQDWGSL
jgi:hypothetical protein